MAATRRRKIGHRRRLEDEGDDEGGPEPLDLDDDSLTDGSVITDENDAADDSDTSNVEDASPTSGHSKKQPGHGSAEVDRKHHPLSKPLTDAGMVLHGLSISQEAEPIPPMQFDEVIGGTSPPPKHAAPIIVSSASVARSAPKGLPDRQRREHEEYKRRRDEDPAFVPNRGAFFMHDHRHAGPSANGFRPFQRATRGRGRGGFGASFAPIHQQLQSPNDPLTSGRWDHDMHEAVSHPSPPRPARMMIDDEGPFNGDGIIRTCPPSSAPINRTLSTEKDLGNVQVRVVFPGMKGPITLPCLRKLYTKLPDHRPPLRRDKPVRISLPNNPPRYIFPAVDRSFIFIPRAMRPNQQRARGKPRSGLGSIGGYSRRTSVFGGSYYGSVYSPSIQLSRRSSLAPDSREYMFSPTGSVVSRPPMPSDTSSRPLVRLPPQNRPEHLPGPDVQSESDRPGMAGESSITDLPPPQTHPLPQKPTFQESRPSSLPMHQPRPQKTVSVADIESPTLSHQPAPQPYQQAFHQQVPLQVSNNFAQDSHTRNPSYPSQHSTGTPLSHIPERAIHAAPFHPNSYPQPGFYNQQPYPVMQPAQGFYYPQTFNNAPMQSSTGMHTFVPAAQQSHPSNYAPQSSLEHQGGTGSQHGPANNLIAQELNGMVYYYDPSHLNTVGTFPSYQTQQGFVPGVVGIGGVVPPSPDGFFSYQANPGVIYYPQ